VRLTTRRWFGIEIVETGIHFRGFDMHDIRIRKDFQSNKLGADGGSWARSVFVKSRFQERHTISIGIGGRLLLRSARRSGQAARLFLKEGTTPPSLLWRNLKRLKCDYPLER
jgi:hypothetical protein